MFILGMVTMYFLLNLVVIVLLIQEIEIIEMLKEKQDYLKVTRIILVFLLAGTALVFAEVLQ